MNYLNNISFLPAEDQWERKRQDQAKKIIAWTDPNANIDEKREYVWAPSR